MECQKALQLLTAYIDKELDERQASDIKAHLNICEKCRKRCEFLSKLADVVKSTFAPETVGVPEEVPLSILEEVKRRTQPGVLVTECQSVSQLLTGYLDDELIYSQYANIKEHLNACAKCKAKYESLSKLADVVKHTFAPATVRVPKEAPPSILEEVRRRTQPGPGVLVKIGQSIAGGGRGFVETARRGFEVVLARPAVSIAVVSAAVIFALAAMPVMRAINAPAVDTGHIIFNYGQVNMLKETAEIGNWQPATLAMKVESGDKIVTKTNSGVNVEFDGGKIVHLMSNADIQIGKAGKIHLNRGRILAKTDTPCAVYTRDAAVVVKGTTFSVEAISIGGTDVWVLEGAVSVNMLQKDAWDGSFTVKGGHRLEVPPNAVRFTTHTERIGDAGTAMLRGEFEAAGLWKAAEVLKAAAAGSKEKSKISLPEIFRIQYWRER